jgi:hypothetical protein
MLDFTRTKFFAAMKKEQTCIPPSEDPTDAENKRDLSKTETTQERNKTSFLPYNLSIPSESSSLN